MFHVCAHLPVGLGWIRCPRCPPALGRGPAGLPSLLNNHPWVSARCYCWPFWFHSQFPDSCPHRSAVPWTLLP